MKQISLILLFILCYNNVFAQEEIVIEKPVDSLYREDQFYVNVSYNMMQNKPSGYTQKGYFSNLGVGFLRDFPLNKRRNISIAPGLGYTYSRIKSNLMIIPESEIFSTPNATGNFTIIDEGSASKNVLTFHNLDLPIEFRWRTSVADSHKFFRIYTGIKFSYIFSNRSIYKDAGEKIKATGLKEINNFQTGVYMAVGYNTWNAYAYYGLTPLFKSAEITGQEIEMNAFHLGLAFYIL